MNGRCENRRSQCGILLKSWYDKGSRRRIARGKSSLEDRLECLWIKGKEPVERGRFMIKVGRRQLMKLGSTAGDRVAEGRHLALTWRRTTSFPQTEI